jgi:hypothetical protein
MITFSSRALRLGLFVGVSPAGYAAASVAKLLRPVGSGTTAVTMPESSALPAALIMRRSRA